MKLVQGLQPDKAILYLDGSFVKADGVDRKELKPLAVNIVPNQQVLSVDRFALRDNCALFYLVFTY